LGGSPPDFKTLADFRAQNGAAIKNVCREFIVLCRSWGLFTEATVAIDGSKFKAVNHRDRNFTPGKMKTRMGLIEQSITEYLQQLDRMDRKETPISPRGTARLRERIATKVTQHSSVTIHWQLLQVELVPRPAGRTQYSPKCFALGNSRSQNDVRAANFIVTCRKRSAPPVLMTAAADCIR
jgi:hypothetical protein